MLNEDVQPILYISFSESTHRRYKRLSKNKEQDHIESLIRHLGEKSASFEQLRDENCPTPD